MFGDIRDIKGTTRKMEKKNILPNITYYTLYTAKKKKKM